MADVTAKLRPGQEFPETGNSTAVIIVQTPDGRAKLHIAGAVMRRVSKGTQAELAHAVRRS